MIGREVTLILLAAIVLGAMPGSHLAITRATPPKVWGVRGMLYAAVIVHLGILVIGLGEIRLVEWRLVTAAIFGWGAFLGYRLTLRADRWNGSRR